MVLQENSMNDVSQFRLEYKIKHTKPTCNARSERIGEFYLKTLNQKFFTGEKSCEDIQFEKNPKFSI